MMDMDLVLFQRLAVAFAIGLLIGIERGWVERKEPEGGRSAGMRTLALSGLLGGVAGALSLRLESGGVLLGLVFVVYALAIAIFRFRETTREKTYGATTVVAAFLTFALGALAVVGDTTLAAAAGVAAAALLALKAVLHSWLERLTWEELRAGLVLLAMTVILLPLLPDRGMGPAGALNPHELWLMTILIAAVSAVGYIAMKLWEGRGGIIASGITGGLVSSTAVTLTLSRLARAHPAHERPLVAGVTLAAATSMIRILIIAGSFNLALLGWLVLPLGLAATAFAGMAAFYLWKAREGAENRAIPIKNPFELTTVLQIGGLLAVVVVAAKLLTDWAGGLGAYALAAVSGIADVDAIALSMAGLGGRGLSLPAAAGAILIAAAVNTIGKAVLAWMTGGPGPGRRLAVVAAAGCGAGLAGFLVSLLWGPLQIP